MADNVGYTPGAGATVAADEIAGVLHQRVKIEHGADGSATDVSSTSPLPTLANGTGAGEYAPNQAEIGLALDANGLLLLDPDRQLMVRGPTLTDEGGFYSSFPGAALPAEMTKVEGTGGTVTVANSRATIASGTTIGSETYITLPLDYLPVKGSVKLSISQRIANQDIYFELADGATPAADTQFARLHWTGTTDTLVRAETQSSGDTNGSEGTAEDLTQTASSGSLVYSIETAGSAVMFFSGSDLAALVELATRTNEKPGIYTVLNLRIRIKNGGSAPASTTSIVVEWIAAANTNRLDVGSMFKAEAIPVALSSASGGDVVRGDVADNSTAAGQALDVLPVLVADGDRTLTGTKLAHATVTTAGDLKVTLAGELVALGSNATPGSAVPATAQFIAGTDGTNARALKVDAAGEAQVDVLSLPSLPAGGSKIGGVDLDSDATLGSAIPAAGQLVAGSDGTLARAIKTDAAGELQIDVLTLPSVTVGAALPAGANNIGDVDVLTLPALPAGTNNIGDVDIASLPNEGQQTMANSISVAIASDQSAVTAVGSPRKAVKSAGGTFSTSGNHTLVAAVASNKIKVVAFSLTTTSTTAVVCIFQSGAGGTEVWRAQLQAISGANTGANLAIGGEWHLFETAVNTLLNLNTDQAVAIHWSVSYIEEA